LQGADQVADSCFVTTVTLLIFSGRPDPSWELAAGEVASLVPHVQGLGPAPEISSLGYRGFLVRSDDPGMPPEVVVRHVPELERLLLRTGERRLSPEIIRVAADAIK
jgi:hypothetical protein